MLLVLVLNTDCFGNHLSYPVFGSLVNCNIQWALIHELSLSLQIARFSCDRFSRCVILVCFFFHFIMQLRIVRWLIGHPSYYARFRLPNSQSHCKVPHQWHGETVKKKERLACALLSVLVSVRILDVKNKRLSMIFNPVLCHMKSEKRNFSWSCAMIGKQQKWIHYIND